MTGELIVSSFPPVDFEQPLAFHLTASLGRAVPDIRSSSDRFRSAIASAFGYPNRNLSQLPTGS